MLTVNVSDFVVQEILEQLWDRYLKKYGENDALLAEKTFNEFRGIGMPVSPVTKRHRSIMQVIDGSGGPTDLDELNPKNRGKEQV